MGVKAGKASTFLSPRQKNREKRERKILFSPKSSWPPRAAVKKDTCWFCPTEEPPSRWVRGWLPSWEGRTVDSTVVGQSVLALDSPKITDEL